MSGGRLVMVDKAGRDVKLFPLAEGLATLGSDLTSDIRILLPTVSPHHATVVVHANQTIVRNVCEHETLVNGRCVSVVALRHGDVISIGGRHLRWEYADPTMTRPQAPEPGSAGAKQVAIVQPQKRDTSDQIDINPPRTPPPIPEPPRVRRTTASAKKSTPLRLTVLRRAQSAQKMRVTKIEAPPPAPHIGPNATILEITDSDGRDSSLRTSTASRRSGQKSPKKSYASTRPRKSALRDPSAKRGIRKTETIKLDLSNLENRSQDTTVMMVTDTSKHSYEGDSDSDDVITFRYFESSAAQTPSPRRSIHSRSSRILEQTLGTTLNVSLPSRTDTPKSPRPKRSLRGSTMIQKALNQTETLSYSSRTTKSVSYNSRNATVASAYMTRTLRPRTPRNDLESYSIVDLVSIDTDESPRSTSVYDSAASTDGTAFGTPQNSTGRKTRSTIDPIHPIGSSTPYVKGRSSTLRSQSNPSPSTLSKTFMNGTQSTARSSKSRRSKSLSTPENTEDAKKHVSVNSTRISRASRSRSRINDSDVLLFDDDDDSPMTFRSFSTTLKSTRSSAQTDYYDETLINSPAQDEGISTPENRHSPEEASTTVLSIQSLLNSSQSSIGLQRSTRRAKASFSFSSLTGPKSMNFSARKTRLRLSSDSVETLNKKYDEQNVGITTPKSSVKLVQEEVKNKHSTAKKPQSKRSMIDDLNESDIVKQLFNSPVKRKLSQSMTEFSRKHLFDDDDIVQAKRPTRNNIALTGLSPDDSLFDHTESYTTELFVSPISTPPRSPNLEGIKLMFAKTIPENDLRDVRGVKGLLRTPRTRKSIKNDLTDVSGVKNIFYKSPKNRLSDVRVKELFASSPKNDLTRVSGVKSLFQPSKSPRNELDDVRGVKKLFETKSPAHDLRNASGVKRTLRNNSPKNDLRDVRGVKRMFRREKRNDLNDVSGVEELFNLSDQSYRDAENLFDQVIGKPWIRAVYSKKISKKTVHKTKGRKSKVLRASLDVISKKVEEWLEQALNKRLHKANDYASTSKANKSRANMTRELQKLVTETVEGNEPIRTSRVRNCTSVSPTVAVDETASTEHDTSVTFNQPKTTIEVNPKTRRGIRANTENVEPSNASEFVKPSPKKTRGKAKAASPIVKPASPAKEKTVVVAKKTGLAKAKTMGPIKKASPKPKAASPAKKTSPAKVKTLSPVNATKLSHAEKVDIPAPIKMKRSCRKDFLIPESKTKKRGEPLVVAEKAPLTSRALRALRRQKLLEIPLTPKPSHKKTRATCKNVSVESDKPKTPHNTRAKVQKASVVISKPTPQLKPRATKIRGKANKSEQNTTAKAPKTVTVEDNNLEPPKQSEVKIASISTDNVAVEKPETTAKGRKTVDEPAMKKTRNNKQQKPIEEPKAVKTRGKKIELQESIASEPTTRGRRAAKPENTTSEVETRKRKRTSPDSEIPPKGTNNIENIPANQETGKRRRVAAAEPPPAEERSKRPRGGKQSAAPAAETRTRATRANAQPDGQTAGRSRRR